MSSNLASDPFLSAWVAANAGAGKTYTLANRVARLLLADAKPEKILCLTFTKAAAAEMQHRLFRQLGEWAMLPDDKLADNIREIGAEPDDLPKARRLFAQALETPGGLKVLTLHAFCQIVLARFPIEAGVSPGFDVLDDASARALIGEARQIVLERAGDGETRLHEAVALLATEAGEPRLSDILHAALGNDRRKMDRFFDGLNGAAFEDAIWQAHGTERGADPAEVFCTLLRREIEHTAKLSVLHGVPGLTVDVWVDGKRALDNFTPGKVAGPLNVPDGDHKIAITGANATSAANPVIGPVTVDLEAGQDYTAVAHLAANGKPTATLFTNDTSTSPDGKGKLTVRHVAAAPAVDVLAGRTAVVKELTNPHQKTLTLKAGTVSASVAAAGTTSPLIGPANVRITEGKNTIVYAWGSLAAKNLKVAVQVVDSASQGDECDDE